MKKRILAMMLTVCLIMGLLPTSALAVDGEKRITAATATVGAGGTAQTIDWLQENASMSITTGSNIPFTVSVGGVPGLARERTLTITLAKGLQWVTYTSADNPTIERTESDKIDGSFGGLKSYDCQNGSVILTYGIGQSGFSASGAIRADGLLFTGQPTTIEDAITLTYEDTELSEPETYTVDVTITGNPFSLTFSSHTNKDTTPGGTAQFLGNFSKLGGALLESLDFEFVLPKGMKLQEGSLQIRLGNYVTPESTVLEDGSTKYTVSTQNQYMPQTPSQFKFYVDVDESIELNSYQIKFQNMKYKLYGMSEEVPLADVTRQLTVKEKEDPKFSYTMSDTRVDNINWTYYGNDTHDFTEYQVVVAQADLKVANQNLAENLAYYEYIMDASQTKGLFIDRVNIPCSYGQGEEYLPTVIQVTDSEGKKYTINKSTIEVLPGFTSPSGGIFLKASDIPLAADVSIVKVVAWIPGFSGDYQSYGYETGGPDAQRASIGAWGHFKPGEEISGEITASFQPMTEQGGSTYEPSQCTWTPSERLRDGTGSRASIMFENNVLTAGESTLVTYYINHASAPNYGSRIIVDPEFYVFLPPGMSANDITLNSSIDGEIPYLREDCTAQITENSPDSSTGWGEGWTCLKINPAQSGYVTGGARADGTVNDLTLKFTLMIDPSAASGSYLAQNMVQVRSARYNFTCGSTQDVYKINGNKRVLSGADVLTVSARPSISIDIGFRMEGEQNYYSYVEGDPNTQAAFSPGKKGEMRINLYNGTNDALSDFEIYIPIPKQGNNLSPYSKYFQDQPYGFDMSAEVTTELDNWTVKYGTVDAEKSEEDRFSYDNLPILKSPSDNYLETHNMIRLTCNGAFEPQENARFLISYEATVDPDQSDSSNLFRPMVYYIRGGNSNIADNQPHVWTGLQSGVIDGNVYVDTNRNGFYDAGTDTPVRNAIVTAQVKDADGGSKISEAYTNVDGTYKFEGLPANKPVTVTITSPYSNNPSDANAYRIVTTGSLTAAEDGKSGTAELEQLGASGRATINAALVAPYTVTFAVTDGMNSVVIPASLRRFAGQTIGDYNTRVNVVTVAGEQFDDNWSIDGMSGSSISHSNFLEQSVNQDITYRASVSKSEYRVTFAGWQPDTQYAKLFDKTFEYDMPLTLQPSEMAKVSNETMAAANLGYDFLGWREDILGDGELLQLDRDILSKPVTTNHTYYAQYELRKDISVTLDANGGTFTGDRDTLLLENLTYGKTVNKAPDYEEPKKASVGGDNFYFVGWAETAEASTGSSILNVPPESGKTYYAIWAEGEPTKVTVNFDRGGGQWTTVGAEKYGASLEGKPGDTLALPTADDITRTGYTLDGWYTDKQFTTPAKEAYPIGSQILYAKWIPNKHTITYDLNGGTVGGSTENIKKPGVPYDSMLTDIPAPTKGGYALIGWLVDTDDNPADGYIIPAATMSTRKVDGDITYVAQWSANAEQVTFHANPADVTGAVFSDGQESKTFSSAYNSTMAFADVPVPLRTGYTFKGWVTNDDGTGQIQSGSFTFNGATTDYYAQWEATKVTVTFNYNGGKDGDDTGPETFTLNYNDSHPTDIPDVTLAGSQLAYWLDMETGHKYAKDADAEAEIEAFPTGPVTENKTYLAIWNTVQYTVTFTGYNANSDTKTIPTVYGGTPAAPAVTPPAGQVFKHWKVTASESAGINKGATYTSEALLNIKVEGNITFEAVFEAADVTITYIATPGAWDGGETTKTISGKSGETIGAQKPTDPTRYGYDFEGWSKSLTEFPTVNTTLTASWTAKTYTITFDKNVGTDGKPGTAGSESVTVTGTYDQTLENLVAGDIPDPKDFTPSGYTFVGWQDANGAIYPEITGQIVRGKATYTAYFTSSEGNTVTFHANPLTKSGAAFPGGVDTKAYQITTAANFSVNDVPLPVWAEHTFVKWVDAEGQEAPATLTFANTTGGKDYYAEYKTTTYTVTFNYNGGKDGSSNGPKTITGKTLNETVAEGEVPVLTLEGKNFLGWLNLNDNQTYKTAAEVAAVQIKANTSYIALWDTQTFDVTYEGYNQGQPGDTAVIPTVYGQPPAAPAVIPNGGYAFDYWLVVGPSGGVTVGEEAGKTQLTADDLAKLEVTQPITLKAVFKATDYKVTFDANGGTFDGGTAPTYSVAYGKALNTAAGGFTAPTVEKTGAEFLGWTKTGDSSGTLYTNSEGDPNYIGNVTITGDTVFIASWSGNVRVTFNANGGTIADTDYAEGQTGTEISVPTPTRYGYNFGGWYTDSDCNTSAAGDDGSYKFPATNATWYAKWTAKNVTITFNYGDGAVGGDKTSTITRVFDSTVVDGENDLPKPIRAGWTQIGWTRDDGLMVPNANMSQQKVNNVDGMTFTAYYEKNTMSVTFHARPTGVSDAAFSDGVTEKTFSNAYGSTMPFADVPAPVRTGYTFKGWVTSADGTGQIQSGSFTFNGATTDYYAQWEATKVTVTFNPNGGEATGETTFTLNYGENHPTDIPTVTLAGSQLAYWLDMETGKKYAKDADAEAEIEAFPTGAVTKDKTYLAIWNTVQYTVTFMGYDANSGNKEIPTVYGGTPAAPAVTPPAGQVFKHWEVTASDSEGISEGATYTSEALLNIQVKGNVTFKAIFEPADVTITYIATPGAWDGSETTKTISGQSGTAIGDKAPEDPTREGYTFAGWSESLTQFPTENKTLTASWTAKIYTITFDKNVGTDGKPGTAGSESVTVTGTYDQTLENLVAGDIPDPKDFTPSGYTFVGWESTDGSIYPEITSQIVRGEATYIAYFTSSAGNTVTFHANPLTKSGAAFPGGVDTKAYQITTAADFSVTDVPLPVWAEHTFVKWVDAEGQDAPATLNFENTTGGKDYYAEYETTTYTVIFNYNGGKDGTSSTGPKEITGKTLNETVAEGEVPVLTLEGKNFLGWLNLNTNQTYKTAADVAAVQITADTSYIALWDTQTFDVTYQGYNQSSTSDTVKIPTVYGQPPAAPAVIPNGGYAFDYWLVVEPAGGITVDGVSNKMQLTADDLAKLEVTQPITLKAVFKATDYKVTFDANGGTFDDGTAPTYSVAYNQALSTADDFTAPTVEKTGAEFLGWTKAGDGTLYTNNVGDNYIGNVVITGDTVFIASWSGDVRVTFNANGGEITGSDYAEGQSGTVISDVPTPTRYGYDFGGWYTESSCENSAMTDGTYKFPATNATWYAKWTAKKVTVTFNYGKGAVGGDKTSTITKTFDSNLSEADIPAPTLAGFTLTGWSREDGTIIPNANMTSEVINTEGTVTYTAYYTANPITITFNPNGGTFPDGTTQNKSYMKSEGDPMPFADVPVPTLATKTFAGWKLKDSDDSTATTTGNMTFDSAKTYVAVWKDAQYTITFRLNGGSVDGRPDDEVMENLSHGTTFPAIPDVTLAGNTLQGWMNMENGQMYGGTNTAFPTTVTESATYIAIWGTNTYEVTFTKYDYSDQSTGDSSSLKIPTIYEGIPAAPTVTPPTGKQFANWKITSGSLKGKSGNLEVGATVTSAELTKCQVIGKVTLEAQYSDPSYTVTFNPGEGATISSGGSSYTVVNGGKLTEVPTATKDGATSTSWICSLNGKAMTAEEIKNLVIHSNVTFTAVWVGDVTVSFVLNGGHITNDVPASVTGAPGTEVTVPLVSQEGYTFDGWYDAEDGGTPVTFTDGKTTIGNTSVTYYARWTQNTLTVESSTITKTYTGTPEVLEWKVADNAGTELTTDDYSVSYFHQNTGVVTVNEVPTDAGTYTVTIRGKGSYAGQTVTATYIIEPAEVTADAVTVTGNSKIYNGSAQYATVSVTVGNNALVMGRDFTVTYSGNCIDAGSYSITVKGIGNYKGEYELTEQLTIDPKALSDDMIQPIPAQHYTGRPIEPEIIVQDGDLALHADVDFKNVTYQNHTAVGNQTASVTITGMGNYSGEATATFSIIAKATNLEVSLSEASATYGDDLSGMTITVKADGTALTAGQDYQISYQRYDQNGALEDVDGIDQAGVYIITAEGLDNYAGSKGSAVFVLNPKSESDGALVINQSNSEWVYDGANHLPTGIEVKWNDTDELTEGVDYTLSYSYNGAADQPLTADTQFINAGVYVVTAKAQGNYAGTASFVVTITPKNISDADVTVTIPETTYNAGAQKADITVTDLRTPLDLVLDQDYTVGQDTYTDANEAGYEIVITGTGNYFGSRTERFVIQKATITVTADPVSVGYGDSLPEISAINPVISGIIEADKEDVTVTLEWPSDVNVGAHTLVATLSGEKAGNYVADTTGATLTVSAKNMNGENSGVTAVLEPNYSYYNGAAVTPNVVVKDGETLLVNGTDYTVTYKNSKGETVTTLVEVGSYTVTVTGTGNYIGTFDLVYSINSRPSGGGGGTIRYTIEAKAGRGGKITPDGETEVRDGGRQTFQIIPDEGYTISLVLVDGKNVGAVSSYTFEKVSDNHTIEAMFAQTDSKLTFVDVPAGSYYYDAVYWAVEHDITNGTGGDKFSPDAVITRAQMVTFLWRAYGAPKVTCDNPFTDVDADAYYYDAVLWAVSNGVTKGTSATTFSPDLAVTRSQAVTFQWRASGAMMASGDSFSDVPEDVWYTDAVTWAAVNGITKGTSATTFSPDMVVSRAQVVTFLYRELGMKE